MSHTGEFHRAPSGARSDKATGGQPMSYPDPAQGCATGCAGLMMIGAGLFILMLVFGGCGLIL